LPGCLYNALNPKNVTRVNDNISLNVDHDNWTSTQPSRTQYIITTWFSLIYTPKNLSFMTQKRTLAKRCKLQNADYSWLGIP